MALLSDEIIITVFRLQQQLLNIIHDATSTQFLLLERHGETNITLTDLDQLDNVRERADNYYPRFSTLLRQIASSQPLAPPATMQLLQRSIEDAQSTVAALAATIREIRQGWDLS